MLATLDSISQDTKEDILALFNKGVEIVDLMEVFLLSYNEILSLISTIDPKSSLIRPALSQFDFNDEPFIVISDTHFGSYLDNPQYIESVYEFAINNQIRRILHTGDFFQGTRRPVNKKYRDLDKQLEYGINTYPSSSNINNYILLGNHDFHMMRQHETYYQVLDSRKDFNILGFKRAYFTWCKKLLTAYHSTEKYPINLPSIDTFLRLSGHRHELKVVGDHTVFVPTLSDDIKIYENHNQPGFLVIKKEQDKLKVYHYVVLDFHNIDSKNIIPGASIFPQGVVLSKSL